MIAAAGRGRVEFRQWEGWSGKKFAFGSALGRQCLTPNSLGDLTRPVFWDCIWAEQSKGIVCHFQGSYGLDSQIYLLVTVSMEGLWLPRFYLNYVLYVIWGTHRAELDGVFVVISRKHWYRCMTRYKKEFYNTMYSFFQYYRKNVFSIGHQKVLLFMVRLPSR